MNTTTFVARRNLLVVGVGTLLTSTVGRTFAAGKWKWERFGTAPYAASREAAMATRESAFRKLGFPKEVVALLVEVTKKPGKPHELKNGDEFVAQISAGGVVHGLEEGGGIVAFAKPVRGIRYVADAEKWSVIWEGKVYTLLLPEVCYNFTRGLEAAAAQAAAAVKQFEPAGPLVACPNVYTLKVNVWPHEALQLPGVAETHAKEEYGQAEFNKIRHVSREFGAVFRKAHANGLLPRSTTPRTFQVSLIMTAESRGGESTIETEQVLGNVVITGVRELQFTKEQLAQWDAIRVIDVSGDITSPPRFRKTGLHELRFFNHLPGTKLGEWDANPVPDCIMNEHWIE